jgi:membrane protease YdiL (CAAX protease family)
LISAALKNRSVVVAMLLALAVAALFPLRGALWPVYGVLVVAAALWGSTATLHFSVFASCVFLGPRLVITFAPFLVAKLMPLVLYAAVVLLVPSLRRSLQWLRLGTLDRRAWGAVLLVSIVAAAGLLAWTHFAKPDVARFGRLLPDMPLLLLLLYIAAFSLLNALVEELLFRGVMFASLESAFGTGTLALWGQAVMFGVAHYRGPYINGWTGVVLCGLFGYLLGRLRRRTQGLLAPWLAHAAGDFTILMLIVYLTHRA